METSMETSLVDLLDAHPQPEQKQVPQYKIYCDMDGVLTDFEKRFNYFTGIQPKQYKHKYGERAFWHLIDVEIGLSFWSKMPWMPQGKQLWNFISPYNPDLLTSPSKDNNSRLGKNLWVKDNLNPQPKVIFSYSADKQRYSQSNAILIDDKKSNINQWVAKGGIGLRCKDGDIQPIISKLKQLGYE